MDDDGLKARQAPIKERFRQDPGSAQQTLRAVADLEGPDFSCRLVTPHGTVQAGLHPLTGGSGREACSAEMLLEALVGCAGVTVRAVANAMGIDLKGGRIEARGDLDFRGTLGLDKTAPVGFTKIEMGIVVEAPGTSAEQLAKLLQLTERYCVVFQTLRRAPELSATIAEA